MPERFVRASIPKVTQEFVDAVQRAHPVIIPEPHTCINEIMYNAGQQELIRWIQAAVNETSTGAFDNRSVR